MRRRVSDRVLRRWLETGRPTRISRALAFDAELAARLDAFTSLSTAYSEAIEKLVTPTVGFEERTAVRVRARIDGYGTASALVDLLGLGYHVGRALGGGDGAQSGTNDEDDRAGSDRD